MADPEPTVRTLAKNRKARHRFVVLEEIECGVELRGTEVKSLREGGASIAEAYGLIRKGELFLVGATIAEYSHGNIQNHEPARPRRLLAHRRQINAWQRSVRDKGVTIVPLELYFRGHRVKVSMALVRGKKLFDRREQEKRKSASRQIERAMSRRR